MLHKLHISNYALIERSEVDLQGGFTVITGETGSGKSIMLEALALILGSRANFNAIRNGEEKCTVEGTFSGDREEVKAILRENGLDVLKELCLRRELTVAGRSRAFVNDTPVNISLLAEVGRLLIDLHGQQENLALQTATYQCRQLDLFAGSIRLFEEYTQAYHQWRSVCRELSQLKEASTQVAKDQDYFRFQFEELSGSDLNAEVYARLEEQLNQLEHAEDIQRILQHVVGVLENDREGVVAALQSVLNESSTLPGISATLGEIHERLKSASIELKDLAQEAEHQLSGIEADPQQLELVREKLDEYQRLMHKHGVSDVQALAGIRDEYQLKLDSIASFDQELERLEKLAVESEATMRKLADRLSKARVSAKKSFEASLLEVIRQLGMPRAALKLEISTLAEPGPMGNDHVQVLFNANGPEHLHPLSQVASGGEISRVMLALKSIQQQASEASVMVFDEIDTGVSGEVAKRIGTLMKTLGEKTQVIAVTHLPGVAARGDHHLQIKKTEKNRKTVSQVHYLDQNQRIEELASMFSGDKVTEASRESARILLNEV